MHQSMNRHLPKLVVGPLELINQSIHSAEDQIQLAASEVITITSLINPVSPINQVALQI